MIILKKKVKTLQEVLNKYPNWTNERIAETVSNGEAELEIYRKQVRKLRKGNNWNLVADRLLVAASYAINLASTNNVCVVVSEDGDLKNLNEIMKYEIIPLYIARDAYKLTKGIARLKKIFSSPEDLIPFARDHLKASETVWKSKENYEHSAGIVYNPRTDSFSFSTLPKHM